MCASFLSVRVHVQQKSRATCWASSLGLRDHAPAKLRAENGNCPTSLKLDIMFRVPGISKQLPLPPANLRQVANRPLEEMAFMPAVAAKRGWIEHRCHVYRVPQCAMSLA